MSKSYIALILVIIFVAFGAMFSYSKMIQEDEPTAPQGKACTEEARICPDGSAVGRQGENCEFTPCPGDQPAKP